MVRFVIYSNLCGQCADRFINGRRRILQPMLDSAGAAPVDTKPKANKGSSKSAQRFWPENIASLQVQPSTLPADDSNEASVVILLFICLFNFIVHCKHRTHFTS